MRGGPQVEPESRPTDTSAAATAPDAGAIVQRGSDRRPARHETAAHRFPLTGQAIRSILIDGDPWFVAADVCRVLGIGRPQDSVRHLDDDERGRCLLDTSPGGQEMLTVSEPGLYSLILRSRRDEAKAFKRWIVHDVLPSIRTTGGYDSPKVPALNSPEAILQLAEAYADAARRLVGAQKRVAELEPAAEAWETLADAEGDFSIRDAAHVLNRDPAINTGQNRLMRFLRAENLVDRKGVPYVRYSRYLVERPVAYEHPHTGEPVLTHQIRVTADGLAYLRRRLGGTCGTAA